MLSDLNSTFIWKIRYRFRWQVICWKCWPCSERFLWCVDGSPSGYRRQQSWCSTIEPFARALTSAPPFSREKWRPESRRSARSPFSSSEPAYRCILHLKEANGLGVPVENRLLQARSNINFRHINSMVWSFVRLKLDWGSIYGLHLKPWHNNARSWICLDGPDIPFLDIYLHRVYFYHLHHRKMVCMTLEYICAICTDVHGSTCTCIVNV